MAPGTIVGLLVALLILVTLRLNVRSVTIFEFQRGLKYSRGRFRAVLGPGQYWYAPRFVAIRMIDVRPTVAVLSGQEVLSADGVALKVSIAAKYRVVDPALAINAIENYVTLLHTELQLALRAIISASAVEDLLRQRSSLGSELAKLAAEPVRAAGLELIAAEVRDLTLPGELKKIFTQVVRARQEGLAALEKARGETAALRNLANAAQMIERNPHLMQLRLLQVLGQQSGNTVVLGVPASTGPIPVRTVESPGQLPPHIPEQSGEG
jgi:regulator of protease activity HflC (stomatin/prohibitin superfamily)